MNAKLLVRVLVPAILAGAAAVPAGMAAGSPADARVLAAIRAASESTGVDLSYLLAKAYRESGFDVRADAPTSSALGIFQFTRQTWLDLFARHGATYGHAGLAGRVVRGADGGISASDPKTERRILALRRDPGLSAQLAAEYARENRATLRRALGRTPGPEELYIAFFLGPQSAVQLLRIAATAPGRQAASVFPEAARSNPSLFFRGDEATPVTVRNLHARLTRSFRQALGLFAAADGGGPTPRRGPWAEPDRLTQALSPAGGQALAWVSPSLSGGEPVKVPPLAPEERAAILRRALTRPDDADPVPPPGPGELPAAVASRVLSGAEIAFVTVSADRGGGLLAPPAAAPTAAGILPLPSLPASAPPRAVGDLPPRVRTAAAEGPMPDVGKGMRAVASGAIPGAGAGRRLAAGPMPEYVSPARAVPAAAEEPELADAPSPGV